MSFHIQIDGITAQQALARPEFQLETDGFMKLGDIKGEVFAAGLIDPEYDELTRGTSLSLIDPEYDELAGGTPLGLIDPEYDELAGAAPSDAMGGTCMPTCAEGFADDALVQHVSDTIGYEMEARMGIHAGAKGGMTGSIAACNAEEWIAVGSTVDSLGSNKSMDIDQMSSDVIGSLCCGDMSAPVNALRSDNRF